VRRRLARGGPPWTRDRANDFDTVTVPERDCDALRDLLIAEGAETVVEVGLAYGSSALAIGEALVAVDGARPLHVIIDPFQATEWSDVGWRLLTEGLSADAAFVDGSHRFHEVFVDLYFLRKLVRPGGIIVLDDHHWPSVRTAEHYFEVNMGWRVVPGALDAGTVVPATGSPRLRALRLPSPSFEPDFDRFQPF
jgi:predicted O-methyltransferase YrrM